MDAVLQRGKAGGGEAEALEGHLAAGIAGGAGDQLGAIAVAVEAGLADQCLEILYVRWTECSQLKVDSGNCRC